MCSQWLFPELGEWPLQTQSTKKALEELDPSGTTLTSQHGCHSAPNQL
jgi:hypothetical protein